MAKVLWGSFRDGGRRFVGDALMPIHKRLIATYPAAGAFVAERAENGDLNIFLTSNEVIPTSVIGDADKGRMTAAKMQEIVERSRKRA